MGGGDQPDNRIILWLCMYAWCAMFFLHSRKGAEGGFWPLSSEEFLLYCPPPLSALAPARGNPRSLGFIHESTHNSNGMMRQCTSNCKHQLGDHHVVKPALACATTRKQHVVKTTVSNTQHLNSLCDGNHSIVLRNKPTSTKQKKDGFGSP